MNTPSIEDAPLSPSPPVPPETWTNPRDGSVLRLIPPGEFIMGSTPEQIEAARGLDAAGPLHTLGHEGPQWLPSPPAFYLAVFAVTNAQFARFLNETRTPTERFAEWIANPEGLTPPKRGAGDYRVKRGYGRHPVAHITWFGANAYCRWAGLRLPSEIEWEKGARGPDGRIFPWGDAWCEDRVRWYGGDRPDEETTAPVDAYPEGRSPYDLFQMSGNVDEWCQDYYRPRSYARYASGDLRPPSTGYGRVVRGGSCLRRERLVFRCAMRRGNPAAVVNIVYTGFRCARDISAIGARTGAGQDSAARSP
ncbi:MAG: formylglycine-generating enzyme family protein [Opitutaceae bacterium]